MLKTGLMVMALALPAAAIAQETPDGSDKTLRPEVVKTMYAQALQNFKDPYSVKFYGLHMDPDNDKYVCGSYNAKNAVGGYVGMTPFRFGIENDTFIKLNTPC